MRFPEMWDKSVAGHATETIKTHANADDQSLGIQLKNNNNNNKLNSLIPPNESNLSCLL